MISAITVKPSVPETTANTIRFGVDIIEDEKLVHRIFWEHSGTYLPNSNSQCKNFALLATLPYLMNRGKPALIEGGISDDFLEMVEEAQDLWTRWRPDLYQKIDISCSSNCAIETKAGNNAVMAFSGGVDACFSLYGHINKVFGCRSKEIGLGLLIIGFDIPLDNRDWEQRAAGACKNILDESNVGMNIVRTNWKEICIDWEMSFGMGVISVLLQYGDQFDCGIWSADEPYEKEFVPWGNHSSQNHIFTRGNYPVFASGAGWNRSQKVGHLSKSKAISDNIRVCWAFPDTGINCGRCEKCIRTYLNFQIAGRKTVDAISPSLEPNQVRRVKIKHQAAREFYLEILKEGRHKIAPEIERAVRHVVRMAPFYMNIKRFLDKNPNMKKRIMDRINPRSHY